MRDLHRFADSDDSRRAFEGVRRAHESLEDRTRIGCLFDLHEIVRETRALALRLGAEEFLHRDVAVVLAHISAFVICRTRLSVSRIMTARPL